MSIWIWFRYCFGVAFVGGVVYMIWTISNQVSKMCQVIRNEYTQSRKHENVTTQLVKQINQLIDATLDDDDDDDKCPPLLSPQQQPQQPILLSSGTPVHVPMPLTPGKQPTAIPEETCSDSDSDSSGWDIDSEERKEQEEEMPQQLQQLLQLQQLQQLQQQQLPPQLQQQQLQQSMAWAFGEQGMNIIHLQMNQPQQSQEEYQEQYQEKYMTELIPESDGDQLDLDTTEILMEDIEDYIGAVASEPIQANVGEIIEDMVDEIVGESTVDDSTIEVVAVDDSTVEVVAVEDSTIEDSAVDIMPVEDSAVQVVGEDFTITHKPSESEGWMKLTKKEMQTLVAQKGLHTAPSRLNRTELVAILSNVGPN